MTADLPIWLPPLVKERAREAYAGARSAAELAMAKRITTDDRMQGVWGYLQKRRRDRAHQRTAGYEYPAIDLMAAKTSYHPGTFSSRAEWLQQTALCVIYDRMLHLGRLCMPGAPTPSADRYRRRATELRLEAQTLSGEGWFDTAAYTAASHLVRAANCFDTLAESYISSTIKATPAALMAGVARHMTALFGKSMYTQSAIISGVVLDREVTRQQVRDSCCGLWGNPAKKTKKSHISKI
jgi:hypothetical protein